MNPVDYRAGTPVMVRGRKVRLNEDDINRYFRTELSEDQEENIREGVTWDDLYKGRNLDLANDFIIEPMTFWVARDFHIKHTNLKIELGVWHLFISHSLRPRTHITTASLENAIILHCIQHRWHAKSAHKTGENLIQSWITWKQPHRFHFLISMLNFNFSYLLSLWNNCEDVWILRTLSCGWVYNVIINFVWIYLVDMDGYILVHIDKILILNFAFIDLSIFGWRDEMKAPLNTYIYEYTGLFLYIAPFGLGVVLIAHILYMSLNI